MALGLIAGKMIGWRGVRGSRDDLPIGSQGLRSTFNLPGKAAREASCDGCARSTRVGSGDIHPENGCGRVQQSRRATVPDGAI